MLMYYRFPIIVFVLLMLSISHENANGQTPNMDEIISSVKKYVSNKEFNNAFVTLRSADGLPRQCEATHLRLEVFHALSLVNDPGNYQFEFDQSARINACKFAHDVLNNKECQPWSMKEKCMAMDLIARDFSYEIKYDSMQLYVDSITSFGYKPTFKYEGLLNRQIKEREENANLIKTFDGIMQVASIVKPDSTKKLYDLAFTKASTWDEFMRLARGYEEGILSNSHNGETYHDHSRAIKCYEKSFVLATTTNEKVASYNFQVGIVADLNLLDSAIQMQKRLPSKVKLDKYQTCQNKVAVGDLYYNHAQYQKALTQYQTALLIISGPEQNSTVCGRISECYYKLGDVKNGSKYYYMSQ